MADQDFNINIRTIADTTGIRLTQQHLDALQKAAASGNKQAIDALKQLSDAQKRAQSGMALGFTGTAVGVGTIVSLVTGAISKWRAFNDEQDKMVDAMLKSQEHARALGDEIVKIQDAMISARRTATEPLEDSFRRLRNDVTRLKTEMSLLNPATQGEEWKKLAADLDKATASYKAVGAAIERENARKAAIKSEMEKAGAAAPGANQTEVQKLQERMAFAEQLAKRTDLTPAESAAARDLYVKTQNDLRDAQIEAQKDARDKQAELIRQRYEGPGEGTLRTEDYFKRGPGAAGTPAQGNATIDDLLNYMKSVWGY